MDEYFSDGKATGSTDTEFADFTNAISKTRMVKIRHPDYEVYRTGVHAYRNVACADCHMPYRSEGGAKFTDHHLQSPLLNISQFVRRLPPLERGGDSPPRRGHPGQGPRGPRPGRVRPGPGPFRRGRGHAGRGRRRGIGRCAPQLVRSAQLRWDYVAANNGMGFHSPEECMRILAAAVDLAGQARVECARILARHGVTAPVEYPDFSTKEKAQELVARFVAGKPPKLIAGGK